MSCDVTFDNSVQWYWRKNISPISLFRSQTDHYLTQSCQVADFAARFRHFGLFQPFWPQDFISGLLAVFRNFWPFLAVFRVFRGFLAFSGLFWLFPSWPGGEILAFFAPYGQIFEIWPQPSENTWQHCPNLAVHDSRSKAISRPEMKFYEDVIIVF